LNSNTNNALKTEREESKIPMRIKRDRENASLKVKKLEKNEEYFLKNNDIEIEHIEGDIDAISNLNNYRNVIKKKIELENTYRKELIIVVNQIQKRSIFK
jgi:hypothetical protein